MKYTKSFVNQKTPSPEQRRHDLYESIKRLADDNDMNIVTVTTTKEIFSLKNFSRMSPSKWKESKEKILGHNVI